MQEASIQKVCLIDGELKCRSAKGAEQDARRTRKKYKMLHPYSLYLIPYTLYPISLRRIGDWGKKEKAADESDLNPD